MKVCELKEILEQYDESDDIKVYLDIYISDTSDGEIEKLEKDRNTVYIILADNV